MLKVWDHFKLKIKDNIMVYLAYHNSTTSILQHLKRQHPSDDTSGRPETSKLSQPLMDKFLQKAPANRLSPSAATRSLVEHLRKNELPCTKLRVKQKQIGTKENMLVQDVYTCWNSFYAMLSTLQEQR